MITLSAIALFLLFVLIAAILFWIILYILELIIPGFLTPRVRGVLYLIFLLLIIIWALDRFGAIH